MRFDIFQADEAMLPMAGYIHSAAWQESHRSFCASEFIAVHTPESQEAYLRQCIRSGARLYMLSDGEPKGIVTVNENLIENLYVLPEAQNRGYGTALLQFAVSQCPGVPELWILNNNTDARRLYEKHGFRLTGISNQLTPSLFEVQMKLQ